MDDFHADIYLNKLLDLPITNIRKLTKLILSDARTNEEAIDPLASYLEQAVQESKDAWELASKDYVDGWCTVNNPKSRRRAVVETLKNNNRLTRKVKAAKAVHKHWLKIQTIWNETKQKMI